MANSKVFYVRFNDRYTSSIDFGRCFCISESDKTKEMDTKF